MQLKSKEVQYDQQNAGQIVSLVEWLYQTARHPLHFDPSLWDVRPVLQ